MRKLLVSLLAFFVGIVAGGLVAQFLAEWTRATEEYILVFAATMVFALVVTAPFFAAQFFAEPRRAVGRVALWCLALFGLVLIGLAGWTLSVPPEQRASGSDVAFIAGLILPNVIVIVAHWLVVRAFHPATPVMRFGRPANS